MSEPIADLLSRLTPNAAGLDRDALLFATGRASARADHRWIMLAASLAVSQLATLAMLAVLLVSPSRQIPALPAPPTALPNYPEVAPAPADLHTRWPGDVYRGLDQPRPAVIVDLAPDAPPLRAFTRTMPDLN